MSDSAQDRARLYSACHGELVGFLVTLLGDRAEAEDIAQDAGMRLIAVPETQPLRNPRAFLFHIATNLARDLLRRRMVRLRTAETMPEPADAPAADVVVQAREEVDRLQRAIARLPERPRQVLLMSRLENLSHGEIGARLGIAAKTVENHLARALLLLTRELGPGAGEQQ